MRTQRKPAVQKAETKLIHFAMPRELDLRLDELARKNRRTKTAEFVIAVERHLEQDPA